METLEILPFGEPTLRKTAKPVNRVNASVRRTLDNMLATMRAASGAGLAAPQVGILKRMVVVDVGDGAGPYFLVNPEIVYRSEETERKWEGCLSWPGYVGEVERPVKVTVKALDRDGHETWVTGEGFLARALCHEIDHLDGILYIDRAETITETPKPEEEEGEEKDVPQRAVFMGSPDFAVPTLRAMVQDGIDVGLVVTQPDRPVGRKQAPQPTPVKVGALELGIQVLCTEDICSDEAFATVSAVSPDVIVVAAFGQKIPNRILELPRYGCINVHPSLLPRYRGGNPIQRAVLSGDLVSGVSIIYLSEKMDAGDILLQKTVEIGQDETFGTLESRLGVLGADALVEALELLAAGGAPRTAQDESKATYAPHLRAGEEVIDWGRRPKNIHDLVRGLSPRPGAVTWFGQERIKVWETRLLPAQDPAHTPGAVLRLDGDTAVVATGGGGTLGIACVQPDGKKSMTARAFLAGRQDVFLAFGSLQGGKS